MNKDNKAVRVLKKLFKAVIIAALCLGLLFAAYLGLIFIKDSRAIKNINGGQATSGDVITTTQSTTSSENIDVVVKDERMLVSENSLNTPVFLSSEAYESLLDKINGSDYEFKMAEYYALEEALVRYINTEVGNDTQTTLLIDGKLDADKLFQKVLVNNSEAVDEDGINQLNYLYSELEEETIKEICSIIAQVINDKADEFDIAKVANTLERLTVFKQGGSMNNAAVTERLAFVVNPSMIEMFRSQQEISGNEDSDKVWYQTLCHEVMHLIQYSSGDGNKENGLEIGFARMYNSLNEEKNIPVDSLYYMWLLEASAELMASEYVGVETITYQKKISYVNSFNLSRFYELSSKEDKIERLAFEHNPSQVLEALGIVDEKKQMEFLRFMFSVEITQSDPDDVWEYYQSIIGRELTDDERLALRMDIRTEAVKYMSGTFFTNLINALRDGAIADLDSLFYMLRVWELDVFSHLGYNQVASLEHAEDYILWHNEMQNAILDAISESSGITEGQIQSMYYDYCLNLKTDGKETAENCNLSGLSDVAQTLIFKVKNDYPTAKFSRINDVASAIRKN